MKAAQLIKLMQNKFTREELEEMDVKVDNWDVTDCKAKHIGFTIHYIELT